MMKFALLAIFIALELSLVNSINWQPGNWAMGCDFIDVEGNNLGQKNGPSSECGSYCQSKSGCTHFVYRSNQNGGTCYIAKGSVSKNDAIETDQRKICGIIKETMVLPKDDYSDESFESTDESDAAQDLIDQPSVTHKDYENGEVAWAKRPCLPWFPGIIVNPNEISKELKNLLKYGSAIFPTKEQVSAQASAIDASKQSEKIYFIFLFNRKKTSLIAFL